MAETSGTLGARVGANFRRGVASQAKVDGPRLFAASVREVQEMIALTYGMITNIDDNVGTTRARSCSSSKIQPGDFFQFGCAGRASALVNAGFFGHKKCLCVRLRSVELGVYPELSSKRQLDVK